MPFISITTPPLPAAQSLAVKVAGGVADAAGLPQDDVIVLVLESSASHGVGAVALVAGRDRGEEVESAMRRAVQVATSRALGCSADLVMVQRLVA